jgi:hypothetical protein
MEHPGAGQVAGLDQIGTPERGSAMSSGPHRFARCRRDAAEAQNQASIPKKKLPRPGLVTSPGAPAESLHRLNLR